MAEGINAAAPLTPQQLNRYARQILLPGVGNEGQLRLLNGRVLIVGVGGLGSPAALYLSAAGVGTIGLVDGGVVDLSNLQRQILYSSEDVGKPKVMAARDRLAALNPDVHYTCYPLVLDAANVRAIISDYDVVVNGCDNFPTRYLLNDACVLEGKPLVDASVLRWEAQLTVFAPKAGCYRCLFPQPPSPGSVPSCAEAGVLGALVGEVGSMQAVEALKLLLQTGEPLVSRLLMIDALRGRQETLLFEQNPQCPVCGEHPTILEVETQDYEGFCGVPLPTPEITAMSSHAQPAPFLPGAEAWLPAQVEEAWRKGEVYLLDVRNPDEYAQSHIEGSHLLPLPSLPEHLNEVPKDRKVICICHVGQRSAQAARLLRAAGYRSVYNMTGGMLAWESEGRPVVRSVEANDPATNRR
ncbi:MAG: molybdopterin-synthase adenylyltransferase MoeB [Firmicutes bacterium]|nr:molybdopterin-synthase adenylyltransferase MoeB [Bacillota bacterium]